MQSAHSSMLDRFQYPVLTKTTMLNFSSLNTIKDEVKANTASIHLDLGGGMHGHLGAVSTVPEYALVLPVPYVEPVNPPPLVIPPGTTQHIANGMRADHKEACNRFKEVVNLKQSIYHQLTQAIPAAYIRGYRNCHSNAIQVPIPYLFTSLMTNYGRVTKDELDKEAQDLKAKVFDITEPLVVMYKNN